MGVSKAVQHWSNATHYEYEVARVFIHNGSLTEREVVRFLRNPLVGRHVPTYSVRDGGEFWMTTCGCRRRAWSSLNAAADAASVRSYWDSVT